MANNNENKVLNVPHLRFPEFSGEWEKNNLSKFSSKITKKNKSNFINNVLCNSANLGIIPQNDYFDRDIANADNTDSYYIIEQGDFVYNPRKSTAAPYGPVNIYNGEKPGIISPLYLCFSVFNISPSFLFYRFKSSVWHPYVYSHGDTGVRYDRVSIKDDVFFDMPIYTPTQNEQEKIATLLSLIDERIATQNKIIEDLKKLKSAIVEMLLCNQNGESFKLRDVGCFVRGLTYANEDVTENKAATTVIRANNLNYGNNVDKDEVVYVNKTPTASQILRKGDIVICMANGSSSLIGKNSYYPFNDGQSTIGAFCGIYRTSYPFVKWLMQSQRYKRLVYQSLQGGNGAIANLNGDDILNMSFPLIEKEKSQSIIFAIDAIEKSLMVNKSLQRLYYTQKSYLLKQIFI
ncbi:restriction endonuclease subunit S [Bacteroides caccae]|uniref:restriction endonuclease subunit S n=1 Tax=Bacteroides caccae TaxID=47678 RepID=UPI0032BF84F5